MRISLDNFVNMSVLAGLYIHAHDFVLNFIPVKEMDFREGRWVILPITLACVHVAYDCYNHFDLVMNNN